MKTSKKVLATLVVVGLAGSLIASAVFSAFSATTDNQNNTFDAGTVSIGDNDLGSALYQLTNQTPGTVTQRCIRVDYTGSLPSNVRLYAGTGTSLAAGAQYVNLQIESGSQLSPTFPDCSGFTPDAFGTAYNGTVQDFATNHTNFTNGVVLKNPSNNDVWNQNEWRVYRFSVSLQNVPAAQGASSGPHTFTWETQNT